MAEEGKDVFAAFVEIGVVFDEAFLGCIDFDGIALDYPVDGGFLVDLVGVGFFGDIGDGDVGIVDDACAIFLASDLLYLIEAILVCLTKQAIAILYFVIGGEGLIV